MTWQENSACWTTPESRHHVIHHLPLHPPHIAHPVLHPQKCNRDSSKKTTHRSRPWRWQLLWSKTRSHLPRPGIAQLWRIWRWPRRTWLWIWWWLLLWILIMSGMSAKAIWFGFEAFSLVVSASILERSNDAGGLHGLVYHIDHGAPRKCFGS